MTGLDVADLVGWLKEQISIDERIARAASAGGPWHYSEGDSVGAWTLYDEHWTIADLRTYRHETYDYAERMPAVRHPRYVDADANGAHIANFDPARVLAEVQSKRLMIHAHDRPHECLDLEASGDRSVVDGEPWEYWEVRHTDDHGACFVLRALAVAYRDREGYQEGWAP